MILGLDVATRLVGCCVLEDGIPVHLETFKLPEDATLAEKGDALRIKLYEIFMRYPIKRIIMEKPKAAFFGKNVKSSAQVIATLNRFNGIAEYLCYMIWGFNVEFMAEGTARKMIGLTIPRGTKAKDLVMEWVIKNEPLFQPELTKFGNIKAEYYDQADAYVLGKAAWLTNKKQ